MIDESSPLALGQIELIAGYVVLAAILLSINLWARIRWPIKFAAIAITTGFFFVTFVSIEQLQGWPTDQQLPNRFEFLHAVVVEPNQARGEPGAIYIWALTLAATGTDAESGAQSPEAIDTRIAPGQMPRAYHLPYTRPMHKKVHEAQELVIEGVRQVAEADREPRKPGERASQTEFNFFDRPQPILPPKGPPPEGG